MTAAHARTRVTAQCSLTHVRRRGPSGTCRSRSSTSGITVRLVEPEWAHLEALVAALVAAGNEVADGGFRPAQGGIVCALRDPLDPGIAQSFVRDDDRLVFEAATDELSCRHCWTVVYGGEAALRYQREHAEAVERRDGS
jgi:hypothetical protein